MPAKSPAKSKKAVAKPQAPLPTRAKAPEVPPVVRPGLATLAPSLESALEDSAGHIAYRGAVPVKNFIGWLVVVLAAAAVVGFVGAHVLVSQRLSQLVEDTAARVALQGQNRAAVVAEWAEGIVNASDGIAQHDLVRMFMLDKQNSLHGIESTDPYMQAVRAQAQSIQSVLEELLKKQGLTGAHMLMPNGAVVLTTGATPELSATDKLSLSAVANNAKGLMQPARVDAEGRVVVDVMRPVMAMEGNNGGIPAVLGVLWVTVPVGNKLAELSAATPLDRPGERTVILQSGYESDSARAAVIGRANLSVLPNSLEDVAERVSAGRSVVRSPIDAAPVFANVVKVPGTPLAVLQEYSAASALSLMDIYKPGLYLVVVLLVAVLGALMLALTIHLMSQRNKTRVRLLGQTMEALVRVVEARDPYLAGHHVRVARLVVGVGNQLKYGVGERATLYYAAQLAAVGRLLVPRDVLAKKGQFTSADRKELENHVQQAVTILGDLEFDLPVVPVIAQMYERIDGSGHPRGLRGHQMHRLSKVLGAADAFAALTSERTYRKALTKTEALRMMSEGQFDEAIVTALKAVGK